MATFYINRNSGEDINSQWIKHLQTGSYIKDIEGIFSQNKQELQSTIQNASSEQVKAINQVCGTLKDGFTELSYHLKNINSEISELRGEINEMAAMLDWKLSMLIEQQRVTNQLLGNIAQILRIPDGQKQRVYFIEQGLKYLKNAYIEGPSSLFFIDAMEGFKEAEKIEKKDYITLNRIGQIYLYSQNYLNIPLAQEYFLKSAREAMVEANAGGTTVSNHFTPHGNHQLIYSQNPYIAAQSEAYLYASRTCYLQQKYMEAIELSSKAYQLIPEFFEAGFELAKYLAANDQEVESVKILESILDKDPYFSIKILQDQDLISKKTIIDFIENIYKTKLIEAEELLNECRHTKVTNMRVIDILSEAQKLISNNTFLSFVEAIKIIRNTTFKEFIRLGVDDEGNLVKSGGKYEEVNFTLLQFIKRQQSINESKSESKRTLPSNNTGCALELILFGITVTSVLICL